jgi:hypothetical protein
MVFFVPAKCNGGNLLDQTTCNNNYRSLSSKASRLHFAKTAETKCHRDKHDPENKGVCSNPKYEDIRQTDTS